MQKALELVTNCSCSSDSGCPSCIQNADCGEYNAVLSKQAAAIVLQATLEAETEYRARTSLQVSLRHPHLLASVSDLKQMSCNFSNDSL